MVNFEKHNEIAREILTNHRNQVLAVVKVTRAGATTSLLKNAFELGQKSVIVAPYIKIFDMTIKDVEHFFKEKKPRIARISANKEICEKVQAKIKQHPCLDDLPFYFRPSCKSCEFNDPNRCKLQNILNNDYDVLGLTYAKMRALCTSRSEMSEEILAKLKEADNLILDEFVTGVITTAPSVPVEDPYSYLNNEFDLFKSGPIKPISQVEAKFREKIPEFVIYANSKGSELKEGTYEFYENHLSEKDRNFFNDNFAKCWHIIEHLTVEGKDTRLLQKIVQIVASKSFFINKKNGKVSLQPAELLSERSSRGSRYLRDFVSSYFSKDKLVALVDACLPNLDLTETLGVTVEKFIWGDPLNTNKSQLIICDTRKIGKISFFKKIRIQQKLRQLINFASGLNDPCTILIATLNKDMARAVKAWAKKGEIPEEIEVTYYRSEFSRGITIDPKHRILILVGGPYIPKISYLAETYGTDKQTAFRRSDMRSAFINLIGRVKDFRAEEKSIIYASGITGPEVQAFVEQKDLPSPWIVKFPVQGADAVDFELVAKAFLHTHELKSRNLQEDLPILARILRIFDMKRKRESTPLSQILQKDTERVQRFIEEYPDVLAKFKIKTVKTSRGYRLESSKS